MVQRKLVDIEDFMEQEIFKIEVILLLIIEVGSLEVSWVVVREILILMILGL